ncbi:MAG TPA: zinc-binding dehydrogenase [Chloroflexota bacterium]|jgi:NADPH:quinone reductase-like Zn-dependent oxidoreductase
MLAVVVDPNAPGRLTLREVEEPVPAPTEAVVAVRAISLNRGEVRRAQAAATGWRPGWDLAGTVAQAAADGSGPPVGARVVGLVNPGAWAERVPVRTDALAPLPEGVSFAQAATLPVAGLTALWALERGGLLLDKAVLVTGASGGVGHLACQLARRAGARVVGAVRQESHAAIAQQAGAQAVVVGDDLGVAGQHGPYDLILESVGSGSLGAALALLAPDGVCVSFGASAGPDVTFSAQRFYATGGATLYGFLLFHEVARRSVSAGLARLAGLVAAGQLRPHIDAEASWSEVGRQAQRLLDRHLVGKIVLQVES